MVTKEVEALSNWSSACTMADHLVITDIVYREKMGKQMKKTYQVKNMGRIEEGKTGKELMWMKNRLLLINIVENKAK